MKILSSRTDTRKTPLERDEGHLGFYSFFFWTTKAVTVLFFCVVVFAFFLFLFLFFLLWAPPPPCNKKRDDTREKRERENFFFLEEGVKFSLDFLQNFFCFFLQTEEEREGKKKPHKKGPLFTPRLNNKLKTMFQRAAATPLSMRSSVRPFAAQCNNNKRHQRAPASISMTRRRHHVVSASFSVSDITGPVNDTVNDLKSTEVRNFPQLYSSSSLGERITIRFRLFAFFDDRERERERRAEDHLLLQFYQKTTPHPRARAFERRRKKGEKKKKKKTTVWRTGFDSI